MFICCVDDKMCIFVGSAHIVPIFLASGSWLSFLLLLEESAGETAMWILCCHCECCCNCHGNECYMEDHHITEAVIGFKAIPWHLWSVLMLWESLVIMNITRKGEGWFYSATSYIFLHGDNLHIREDLLTILCEVGAYFNRSTWVRKQMCAVASWPMYLQFNFTHDSIHFFF